MRKIMFSFLVVLIVASFSYAKDAIDAESNHHVIYAKEDARIEALLEQMDEARIAGDDVFFQSLLRQYKDLRPTIPATDGPQIIVFADEPVHPEGEFGRWDADVQVDIGYDYQAFSMDSRDDGFIFLAASRSLASGDDFEIPVFYSSDGITWTLYTTIFWGGHDCYNPSLKVVEQDDTSWIFIIFNGRGTASPFEEDIWILRHPFGGSVWDYFPVADVSGLDERNPSLDSDDLHYPTSAYLYCAHESEDSIIFVRSSDNGATWTNRFVVGAGGGAAYGYYDPSIAFGHYSSSDSMTLGVAWTIGWNSEMDLRFRMCRSHGTPTGWLATEYFMAPDGFEDHRPQLKLTRDVTQTATILYARVDSTTGYEDLCNRFTYDGGRNWADDQLYAGGNYNVLTSLAVDDGANDFHAFFKGDNDDVRYKEAHYDDFTYGGWTFSIPISDGGGISDFSYPGSGVLNGYPYVCWEDLGSPNRIMFDAIWLPGSVEEKPDQKGLSDGYLSLAPNITNRAFNLSYATRKAGNVSIKLYDASGRMVKNVFEGYRTSGAYSIGVQVGSLGAGVYFVKTHTPDGNFTERLTIVK